MKKIIDTKKFDNNIYTYYLVKNKINGIDVFGMQITKKKKHKIIEKKCVKNIFVNKEQALNTIINFSKNLVTPIALKEIVEDILI